MNPLPEDEGQEVVPPADGAPRHEIVRHDCFRQVYLGQISDPLFPPHPEPPEAPEDELTRIALEDPEAHNLGLDLEDTAPTFWRFLAIVFFAVVALGIVFLIK